MMISLLCHFCCSSTIEDVPVARYTPTDRFTLAWLTELVNPLKDDILLEPLAFSLRDYDEIQKNRNAVIQSVMRSIQASGKTLDERIQSTSLLPPNSASRKILRRLFLLKKIIVEDDPNANPQQIVQQRMKIEAKLKTLEKQAAEAFEARNTPMGLSRS